MYGLPTSIKIGTKNYKIRNNGDFRTILDCFSFFQNSELDERHRTIAALIAFYDGLTFDNFYTYFDRDVNICTSAQNEMYNFINCYQKANPNRKSYKLYDWDEDEQLIFSAINQVAGYEVRTMNTYCHWFTFMGYFNQIGEGAFSTVVAIRKKIIEHSKLDKWEQKFKNENPHYFMWNSKTKAQQDREKEIMSLWNKGGAKQCKV